MLLAAFRTRKLGLEMNNSIIQPLLVVVKTPNKNKNNNNNKTKKSTNFVSYLPLFYYLVVLFQISNNFNLVNCQQTCDKYNDIFVYLNKYDPEFDQLAYTTQPVRVDNTSIQGLLTFAVTDKDSLSNNVQQFTITTNDTNFNVKPDPINNQFILNLNG